MNLGRILFYETRLSKGRDVSCYSCHSLKDYGVDGKRVSSGHNGQLGGRNSPTVYHAAGHLAQFWSGRAVDVEEQSKGPVLNPVEMAMTSEAEVVETLRSIALPSVRLFPILLSTRLCLQRRQHTHNTCVCCHRVYTLIPHQTAKGVSILRPRLTPGISTV